MQSPVQESPRGEVEWAIHEVQEQSASGNYAMKTFQALSSCGWDLHFVDARVRPRDDVKTDQEEDADSKKCGAAM